MDEEQLEHKTSLAMAKEEERIYEQMKSWFHRGTHRHHNMFTALPVAQQVCLLTPWQSRTIPLKILWTFKDSIQNCLKL